MHSTPPKILEEFWRWVRRYEIIWIYSNSPRIHVFFQCKKKSFVSAKRIAWWSLGFLCSASDTIWNSIGNHYKNWRVIVETSCSRLKTLQVSVSSLHMWRFMIRVAYDGYFKYCKQLYLLKQLGHGSILVYSCLKSFTWQNEHSWMHPGVGVLYQDLLDFQFFQFQPYCWRNPANQLRLLVYPIICSFFHQKFQGPKMEESWT